MSVLLMVQCGVCGKLLRPGEAHACNPNDVNYFRMSKRIAELRRLVEKLTGERDAWAMQCNSASESLAEALSEVSTLRAIRDRLSEALGNLVDPVTGEKFFMVIEDPEGDSQATFGGPFDSYTMSERDDHDDSHGDQFMRRRYDHDLGRWLDWETTGKRLASDEDETAHSLRAEVVENKLKAVSPRCSACKMDDYNHSCGVTFMCQKQDYDPSKEKG